MLFSLYKRIVLCSSVGNVNNWFLKTIHVPVHLESVYIFMQCSINIVWILCYLLQNVAPSVHWERWSLLPVLPNMTEDVKVNDTITVLHEGLKPLSQLAPVRFKTLCDLKFSHSYVLSLLLHDASHLFYATKWSHQVASEYWTCSKFRGSTWRFKSLHWVSRTVTQCCTTLC